MLGFTRPAGHAVIAPAGAPACHPGAQGTPEGAAGPGRVGCWALLSGVGGAAPAPNPCLLPLFVPRSHKGRGLRVDACPTTQPQCRELPHTSGLPAPSPPPRTGYVLAAGYWWAGPGQSASGGTCGIEAAPGKGLGKTPPRHPKGADGLGPGVLNESSVNIQVCVSLAGGGWQTLLM